MIKIAPGKGISPRRLAAEENDMIEDSAQTKPLPSKILPLYICLTVPSFMLLLFKYVCYVIGHKSYQIWQNKAKQWPLHHSRSFKVTDFGTN